MHRHSGCIVHEYVTRMYFKNIWAELSYEFGPSCLINLGRVGMGRVLCGLSWHGPSWFWAELSVIRLNSVTYDSKYRLALLKIEDGGRSKVKLQQKFWLVK